MMQTNQTSLHKLPDWVPNGVRLYLDHTEEGLSLREIARRDGRNASTILRLVRRYEKRRDDPLLDEALTALSPTTRAIADPARKDSATMSLQIRTPLRPTALATDEDTIQREGKRVLRRLSEPGAVMAIAPGMEKAVIMREFPDGRSARTGVLDRSVAQAFVLKDWISCRKAGRVICYDITPAGRSALRQMIEAEEQGRIGMAEAAAAFTGPNSLWGDRDAPGDEVSRKLRHNLAESPITVLGRRRDKDGNLFLETELVEAAERLREDFELAQMGPRVTQNWERFLTCEDRGLYHSDKSRNQAPGAARDRVALALRDLGPGLGDVALRVCCYLEGVETAEQRMGWAARSGKIVLRIALQRLRRHYDETYGRSGPLIG